MRLLDEKIKLKQAEAMSAESAHELKSEAGVKNNHTQRQFDCPPLRPPK